MSVLHDKWAQAKKDTLAIKGLTKQQKDATTKVLKSFSKGLGKQLDTLEKVVKEGTAAKDPGTRSNKSVKAGQIAADANNIIVNYRQKLTAARKDMGQSAWDALDKELENLRKRLQVASAGKALSDTDAFLKKVWARK